MNVYKNTFKPYVPTKGHRRQISPYERLNPEFIGIGMAPLAPQKNVPIFNEKLGDVRAWRGPNAYTNEERRMGRVYAASKATNIKVKPAWDYVEQYQYSTIMDMGNNGDLTYSSDGTNLFPSGMNDPNPMGRMMNVQAGTPGMYDLPYTPLMFNKSGYREVPEGNDFTEQINAERLLQGQKAKAQNSYVWGFDGRLVPTAFNHIYGQQVVTNAQDMQVSDFLKDNSLKRLFDSSGKLIPAVLGEMAKNILQVLKRGDTRDNGYSTATVSKKPEVKDKNTENIINGLTSIMNAVRISSDRAVLKLEAINNTLSKALNDESEDGGEGGSGDDGTPPESEGSGGGTPPKGEGSGGTPPKGEGSGGSESSNEDSSEMDENTDERSEETEEVKSEENEEVKSEENEEMKSEETNEENTDEYMEAKQRQDILDDFTEKFRQRENVISLEVKEKIANFYSSPEISSMTADQLSERLDILWSEAVGSMSYMRQAFEYFSPATSSSNSKVKSENPNTLKSPIRSKNMPTGTPSKFKTPLGQTPKDMKMEPNKNVLLLLDNTFKNINSKTDQVINNYRAPIQSDLLKNDAIRDLREKVLSDNANRDYAMHSAYLNNIATTRAALLQQYLSMKDKPETRNTTNVKEALYMTNEMLSYMYNNYVSELQGGDLLVAANIDLRNRYSELKDITVSNKDFVLANPKISVTKSIYKGTAPGQGTNKLNYRQGAIAQRR